MAADTPVAVAQFLESNHVPYQRPEAEHEAVVCCPDDVVKKMRMDYTARYMAAFVTYREADYIIKEAIHCLFPNLVAIYKRLSRPSLLICHCFLSITMTNNTV